MRRTIITITDSKKSVIEKKEFSKEHGKEAMDYWCEIMKDYTSQKYNSKSKKTKNDLIIRVEFSKPSEETVMVELRAFDN